MLKRKCPSCAKKIEKSFSYCPYCGDSFKVRSEKENFGFLGRDDSSEIFSNQEGIKIPFGLHKIFDSLVKQLEKQMEDIDFEDSSGNQHKGFKIKISTGRPGPSRVEESQEIEEPIGEISKREYERRINLPKVNAESRIRRLSDKIIYEILTPGVRVKKNIVLNELASGIEVKAYSKNKCYVKYIPIKVEVVNYYLEGEKLFVEFKA